MLIIQIAARVGHREVKIRCQNRDGPRISHLFFADNLTLLATADSKNCNTIMNTLTNFSTHSGQRINTSKSKVIFSRNYSTTPKLELTTILFIPANESFGKYLGFSILQKKPTNTDFQFIIDNLNSRLVGWKTNFLNMAGRTTLKKSS